MEAIGENKNHTARISIRIKIRIRIRIVMIITIIRRRRRNHVLLTLFHGSFSVFNVCLGVLSGLLSMVSLMVLFSDYV